MLWFLFPDILRLIKNIQDRIFASTYQWSRWQIDSVVSEVDLAQACFTLSLTVKWKCLKRNILKLNLLQTWWQFHRNVLDATTSIQRQSIEAVHCIWAVSPLQKWLYLRPVLKMMLITFFDKQGLDIYQDMIQNINLIIGLFQIKVDLVVCSSSSIEFWRLSKWHVTTACTGCLKTQLQCHTQSGMT